MGISSQNYGYIKKIFFLKNLEYLNIYLDDSIERRCGNRSRVFKPQMYYHTTRGISPTVIGN